MQMVGEGLGIGFNRESYVMYMKKQENVRYYCMRNIDSTTDFVLAYRKEMPVTGYMQRMIDMLMAHGRECEKIFPQVIRQHGCQNAF
jgi:DNA-binding transcriptional LysR family regulator